MHWLRRIVILAMVVLGLGLPSGAETIFVDEQAFCTDSILMVERGEACMTDAGCSLCYDGSDPAQTDGTLCTVNEDCTTPGFTLCQAPGVCGQSETGSNALPFRSITG